MMLIIYFFIVCLTTVIAGKKGRSKVLWFLIALVFGIFAFLAALIISDNTKKQTVV